MMILDTKSRILIDIYNLTKNNEYYLTSQEMDLLLILSDNNLKTYDDMCQYCFGYHAKSLRRNISVIKSRLERSCKWTLDIKVVHNVGYILNTEILIE